MKRILHAVLAAGLILHPCSVSAADRYRPRPRAKYRRVRPKKVAHQAAGAELLRYFDAPGEEAFYAGDFSSCRSILEPLRARGDRSYALWCNQLGSVYLAEGSLSDAAEVFQEAFLVMNSIDAFRNLERRALRLSGAESEKGYKGDPYEKVYNSLYLALLLYASHDTENALAALRNGILCDSDVEKESYKSDVTLMYLLAARCERERGNFSLADDYYRQALAAYQLSHPVNRDIVWQEQGAQAAAAALRADSHAGTHVKNEIERLESEISRLQHERRTLGDRLDTHSLSTVADPANNVLLVVELGRSPRKAGAGAYAEKAVFEELPYSVRNIRVSSEPFFTVSDRDVLKYNDVYYQASTRGGRKMDAILAGKAQFKQSAAEASDVLARLGVVAASEASGMESDKRDKAYGVAGALFLAGLFSAIASRVTKPAADLRHWSFLPAEVQVVPLRLQPGVHRLTLRCYTEQGEPLGRFDRQVEVRVEAGRPHVVFTRIFE